MVAGEVAEAVVDALEVVDVEHDQRQVAAVAQRAPDLALERLDEVAPVEDLREAVDRGEPVDLLVVRVLDVVAGEELEDAAADLDEVAVAQHVLVDHLVVDVGAVGRPHVAQHDRVAGVDDLAVVARHRFLIDLDVGLRRPADDDLRPVEVELLAELEAVDDDQARLLGDRPVADLRDRGDDGLVAARYRSPVADRIRNSGITDSCPRIRGGRPPRAYTGARRVIDLIAAAHEPIRLQQHAAAVLVPVAAHVDSCCRRPCVASGSSAAPAKVPSVARAVARAAAARTRSSSSCRLPSHLGDRRR